MIDLGARAKLKERQNTQAMMEATKNAIMEGFKSKGAEDTLKMVFEKHDDQEVKSLLEKIGNALPLIYKVIPRTITLPKIFQIRGSVKVENPISVNNLSGLERKIDDVATRIGMLAQAISNIPQQKIEFPKIEIPKTKEIDFSPVIEAIQNQDKGPKTDDSTPVLRDIKKVMQAIADKPTMTPQPISTISINPLRGIIKTSSCTVGASLTKLPDYGQLQNRRAMLIYNNSANTIYIGGSDISVSTGLPIPSNSFSPILDIGYDAIVYGIASQGGNNVRVMEVSDDNFPGHPGL